MIGPMAELPEVIRHIAAVLEKVRQGLEVFIEQDHCVTAVIRPATHPGRTISHFIALAKAL